MKSNKSRKKVTGMRVVRVTKTEFELDNGDIYPLPFELDKALSLKEFNEIYANSKVHTMTQMKLLMKNINT